MTSTTLCAVSGTDDLLQNNRKYAAAFDQGGLPARPRSRVAIVSCMDARLDPAASSGSGRATRT